MSWNTSLMAWFTIRCACTVRLSLNALDLIMIAKNEPQPPTMSHVHVPLTSCTCKSEGANFSCKRRMILSCLSSSARRKLPVNMRTWGGRARDCACTRIAKYERHAPRKRFMVVGAVWRKQPRSDCRLGHMEKYAMLQVELQRVPLLGGNAAVRRRRAAMTRTMSRGC